MTKDFCDRCKRELLPTGQTREDLFSHGREYEFTEGEFKVRLQNGWIEGKGSCSLCKPCMLEIIFGNLVVVRDAKMPKEGA